MTEEKKQPEPAPAPSSEPKAPEAQAGPGSIMVRRPDASFAPLGDRGVILRTFDELRQFAKMAVESGVAPRDMKPGAAALAIQAGLERGLGPLGGLKYCTVIEGTLSWNAQGASALIQNSPVCKLGSFRAWVEGEGEDRKGVAVAHRVGYAEPFRAEFSIRDARRAELLDRKNWRKYPDRQLQARAIGFLARDGFSDVLGGFPLAEEVADYHEPKPINPPSSPRVTVETPAPARGPDPVLEALEAPVVIEVEPSGPPAEAQEGAAVPPTGTPDLEAQAEEPEPPAEELEAPPTVLVKDSEGREVSPAGVSSLRSKLGVPRAAAKPAQEGAQEGNVEASEADNTQPPPEGPQTANVEAEPCRHCGRGPEVPELGMCEECNGIEELDAQAYAEAQEKDRAAHLKADAELAREQGGLFNGKDNEQ